MPVVTGSLGSKEWQIAPDRLAGPTELAGYTDRTSVRSGRPFRLYATSTAGAFTVRAFRIGWYRGAGARLIWTSPSIPGVVQPAPAIAPDHMVSTNWKPSLTVATSGWPPGTYLLLLTAANGKQKYVPITVRSNSSRGAVVIVNAVNTYQAYNAWGGYSLYHGPDNSYATRSHRVSFDRPYDGNGAPLLFRFELPLLQLADRSGVRLAYLTSVDLDADRTALSGARGVASLGHDEYWSLPMRAAVTHARDIGTNLAFLGGNSVYWRVRFAADRLGPDRIMICYKDATLDPVRNRPDTTVRWMSKPYPNPENSLNGMLYVCYSRQGRFVVREPRFFLFAGTHAVNGTSYPLLAGAEVDRAYRIRGTPANLEVVAHSPALCGARPVFTDATYYTVRSGAGVFSTGSMNWVSTLDDLPSPTVTFARTVTLNLLRAMSSGPLARKHPSIGNLGKLHRSGRP
ncbi:N,N-dimethylformamidase beta subunit family domain-containing protein [Kribbella sp.]|uniref:N,N-dimethylformamidase beta subunit family domain-containing protein n=1 Tax=Kribbella sp. TaxID=1871183 RepID=UPI002D74CE6C|nr:N,N-dimethylformamidase beta subunit family domain-containing protein [Kribbella sp.]HZX05133.1 N,N-dimethylformamidase beta subunit family domain-containing protein [Kribbella sp.]